MDKSGHWRDLMKDLNREAKRLLIAFPVILVIVIGISVVNNRSIEEREFEEALKRGMEEHLEEIHRVGYPPHFQEEINTLAVSEIKEIERIGGNEVKTEVHLSMIDFPSLMEEYVLGLTDENRGEEILTSTAIYHQYYDELFQKYKEKDPHIFVLEGRFEETTEGEWELLNKQDFVITVPETGAPFAFHAEIQRLTSIPRPGRELREMMSASKPLESLVRSYEEVLYGSRLRTEVSEGEEGEPGEHLYEIHYESFSREELFARIEEMLIEDYGHWENREGRSETIVEEIIEIIREYRNQEKRESFLAAEFRLQERPLGFYFAFDIKKQREVTDPYEKVFEYGQFFEDSEYLPEFFVNRYEVFQLMARGSTLEIRGGEEGRGTSVTIKGETSEPFYFSNWILGHESIEEGEVLSVERHQLQEIQSVVHIDVADLYHREHFKPPLLPYRNLSEEGSGFINHEGDVVFEAVPGLQRRWPNDQGESPFYPQLPLAFTFPLDEEKEFFDEKNWINLLIDEEGEIYQGAEAKEMRQKLYEEGGVAEEVSRWYHATYEGYHQYGTSDRYHGVKNGGKWGAMDSETKEMATGYLFDEARDLEGSLRTQDEENDIIQAIMKMDGKQGLYDFTNDRWILEPGKEEEVHYLFDQRRRAESDGKYGFKDENNQWVIEPVYEAANDFYKGYVGVLTEEYAKVLDVNGEVLAEWDNTQDRDPFFSLGSFVPRIHFIPEADLLSVWGLLYFTKEGEIVYSGIHE